MMRRPSKQRLLDLLPDTLVLTHGPRGGSDRYLSFDDGPHPVHTPRLLDVLAAHGVCATFFLIGRNAERYPYLVERIVAAGHSLGNHSWSHPQFGTLDLPEQLNEIERGDQVLAAFDGRRRHRFRSPRGTFSLRLLFALARQGIGLTHWSYDSLDYQGRPAEELAERLQLRSPRPGDIVLMHDDSACAPAALERLLPAWRAAGHTFAPLPAASA
ncbi:MAG TPA: polysaccharide deacetylase family protein [Rhodanobacteraceae bacterium]|nr:polysaccharide deacetylase family protein [Rhodanobacteraceae bacterium]